MEPCVRRRQTKQINNSQKSMYIQMKLLILREEEEENSVLIQICSHMTTLIYERDLPKSIQIELFQARDYREHQSPKDQSHAWVLLREPRQGVHSGSHLIFASNFEDSLSPSDMLAVVLSKRSAFE